MITSIKLKNWKSHKEKELEFKPGVNIIVGPMGAGKSSILQAISFGLFGTFSELKSKDIRISDLITQGAIDRSAEVNLQLKIEEQELNIKRLIREGKNTEAIIRDKEGNLLAGTNPTQVSAYLKEILKLDEELFLRTVYSKQNEIDLFLQLTPGERKKRLDQLMALDKFEDARKNCIKLTNKLEERKKTTENFLKEMDLIRLRGEINSLSSELSELKTEQETIRKKFLTARDEKETIEQQLSGLRRKQDYFNKLEGRKSIILQQLRDFEEKLRGRELDKSLSLLLMRISDIKTKTEEIRKLKSVTRSDLEKNRKSFLELEKQISALEATNQNIRRQIEELEKLKENLESIRAADGDFETIEKQLADTQKVFDNKIVEKQTAIIELNSLKKHLPELEGAEGLCPVCSSKLDEATKEKLIVERKYRIAELENLISSAEKESESLKIKIEELKNKLEKQKTILQKLESLNSLIANERETAIQISELIGKRDAIKEIIEQLTKKTEQIDEEISELDEEHASLLEEKALYEIKDKYEVLQKELQNIEKQLEEKINPELIIDLEKQFQDAISRVQKLKSREDSVNELCKEKEKRLSELKQKESKATELQEDINKFQNKIDFLNQFKNALLIAQSSLRQELIQAVNEIMNSIWVALYPYDKWPAVKLAASETDYTLQIQNSEGNWLPVVGFASGGERMLACLALRIAFAKVLAPNLNMLILDEPTHNLDDAAISTLIEVIQEKLAKTLDQVFIVTHDEKLAEAGQNIIRL